MITFRTSIETISLIFFGTIFVLFVMMQKSNKVVLPVFLAQIPVEATPTPTIPVPVTSVMDSPEGSKTLALTGSQEKEGKTVYTVDISSKSEGEGKTIFETKSEKLTHLEIPYNTWAPDNAYIFLKEVTPQISNYLVFKSSGDKLTNESLFVSIQELFQKKVQNYVIEDVTGWAAPNLLIVNTKAVEGDKKVSFWFDVPSQSFIQLGTYFK